MLAVDRLEYAQDPHSASGHCTLQRIAPPCMDAQHIRQRNARAGYQRRRWREARLPFCNWTYFNPLANFSAFSHDPVITYHTSFFDAMPSRLPRDVRWKFRLRHM